MKWRKLLELSTSSSPPKLSSRASRMAGRRITFEALENRKLFAADLAEIAVADSSATDDSTAEVAVAELFLSDAETVDKIAFTTLLFDETTEVAFETETWDLGSELENPEIRMMTFRGSEVASEVASELDTELVNSVELGTDTELDPLILMTMTGVVDDAVFGDGVPSDAVRSDAVDADREVDVEITKTIDDVISDDDLIFYTLGPDSSGSNPELETTSHVESIAAEDVNGDGNVTALDMLLVINALNSYGPLPGSQLTAQSELSSAGNWDINRDGYVTPLDALLLTNYFNSNGLNTELTDAVDDLQGASLMAPAIARIRNPVDDQPMDEQLLKDVFSEEVLVEEGAPLIEELA